MHPVAVIIPTTLRPSLLRAARSVFRQDLGERFQLLIGIDAALGEPAVLEAVKAECPPHVTLTVLDLGYSTSVRHGGFYPNSFSGSLRTILSYAADSQYVTYLDDDDWWEPDHLSSLLEAVDGRDWAFSYRWLVDRETGWTICRDEWDSIGPWRGINKDRFGGFCCPSTLIMNKNSCHFIFPHWSLAAFADGGGEDRLVFDEIKDANWASTGKYSCFYEMSVKTQSDPHHAQQFAERGIRWPFERDLIEDLRRLDAQARAALERNDQEEAAAACLRAVAINPHYGDSLKRQKA
jgi:hypothetical protein